MLKVDNFEIYENSGGGLTIVLYVEDKVIYADCSMEYCPQDLLQIITLFYQGLTTDDVKGWDSDIPDNFEEETKRLSYAKECIMDAQNVYYNDMGANGMRVYSMLVYECDMGDHTTRMTGDKLYNWYCDNVTDYKSYDDWYYNTMRYGLIKVVGYVE